MATWIKCKSSAAGIPVWVNLTIAQTMVWESDRKHTVIRFGPSEDDAIEVVEKPEDLLKRVSKRGKK
jgi:hypothetical protein